MQNEEQQEQQPFYFWAENLEEYESDNLAYDKDKSENPVIEIKRLNFFIGKNNSGKSRFLRKIFAGICPVVKEMKGREIKFNKISNSLKNFPKVRYNEKYFFHEQYRQS